MLELQRRTFLGASALGLGRMALASLEGGSTVARPRARSVIYLHMAGSPSQQDTFDPKPVLQRLSGTPCPEELLEGKRFAFIKGHPELLGAPHGFRTVGQSGMQVTELMPHFAHIADHTCLVRSMVTDQFNHAPAQLLLHTGSPRFGAASMGSWVSYGLGSANENLPTFMVLLSGENNPSGGKSLWNSAYLPSHHQGVQCRSQGDPVLFVSNPEGQDRQSRRRLLDTLSQLNELEGKSTGDREVESRIAQYELAFRMQASVPEATDIAAEDARTRAEYGAVPGEASFANNCLLARRLVERGVRFVQLFDWGWDLHGTGSNDDLMTQFPKKCLDVDRPIAALLLDLEQRGLLDETLVVFGGEFGRTAMREARGGSTFKGRDHNPECFSMWLAGGGVRAGHTHGESDDLGQSVGRDAVPVGDLQATILHQLGLDPHRLSFPYQGLRQRLIGPSDVPRVRHELLA